MSNKTKVNSLNLNSNLENKETKENNVSQENIRIEESSKIILISEPRRDKSNLRLRMSLKKTRMIRKNL